MNWLQYRDRINRAATFLDGLLPSKPTWCIILGSGLGGLGEKLDSPLIDIPYSHIPGFPKSGVQGHAGRLTAGMWSNQGVVVMEGRFHHYEGHDWSTLVLPVRVLMRIGIRHFVLTNAAGGIREDLVPGDLMMITDHLNLMGGNPLTGENLDEFGPRFPAMTECYDSEYQELFQMLARRQSVELKTGVYAALAGPNYETDAEIRMLKTLGADAVGMSTVPEIIGIRHAGGRAIAISLITNSTGGHHVPTHDEVMDMAGQRKDRLHRIILELIAAAGD